MASARTSRLAERLSQRNIAAFLAQHPVTLGWLDGFHEGSYERFLAYGIRPDGDTRLICPALSASQATRAGIEPIRAWKDGEDPMALFAELVADWGLAGSTVAIDDEMPAAFVLAMQAAAPGVRFVPGQGVLAELMAVKDAHELDKMRRAAVVADQAYEAVLPHLRPGQTELQVTAMVEQAMAERGGKPTFCIVAAGANAAEPHHLSDATPIRNGEVLLLDFGCEVEGYQSDITRTVGVGRVPESAHQVYEAVLRAHLAARAVVRPEVPAQEVDRAARAVIERSGYGELFFHRTGHGIGMRGHENPYIVEGNTTLLQPGHCFSVEPGVYLAGQFGVRLEVIVVVTSEGHESLNDEPSPVLVELGA